MNNPADTEHKLLEVIENRWSPRMFSDKKISEDTLKTLFEAARWAPSSMNEQPWRFMYSFKDSTGWKRAFSCLSDFNQKWVIHAPVLILTAFRKVFDNGKENFHALHDLGLAVANLTLQAQSMQIAVHQMAGVRWQQAHEIYDIPDEFHVTTALALGYYGGDISILPDDLQKSEMRERTRKSLEKIIFKDDFKF